MMTQHRLYKILDFPKHLQVSLLTLVKLGSSTAQEVAKVTGKQRAVESAYLNQLVTMQIVRKERRDRKAFFAVDLEALDW
jgi:ArsR family transcriptional regulator, lead/cadmium/zinc/bismuth-responsive transcriptional repressor